MAKKVKVNIPKGSKDCQGVECNQNLEYDIEIPDTIPTAATIPGPQIIIPDTSQPQQVVMAPPQQVAPPEPPKQDKKMSHEELAELIPDGMNAMACPGGDCGHMKLKNKNQTKKWKACPHCEANTLTKDAEFCPYCTKNVDKDDLEAGVELEEEEED